MAHDLPDAPRTAGPGARPASRRRPTPKRRARPAARSCRSRTSASPAWTTTARCRQGFPEVDLRRWARRPARSRRSPSASSSRGHTLLVTRADREALRQPSARRCRAPIYHEAARAITLRADDVTPGTAASILVAAAGTSDLPVAEEAAVTAEVMGNRVDRLLRRRRRRPPPAARRARPAARRPASSSSSPAWRARCPSVVGGLVDVPGDRRADQRRLRRQLRRHRGAARRCSTAARPA